MNLKSLWNREIGIGYHSACYSYPSYDWLLKQFTSCYKDRHLIIGDVNSNADIATVAGTAVKFCDNYNNSDILALADEDGIIYIINSAIYAAAPLCKQWSVHKNAIFDLEWLPGTSHIVTASGHQVACLVDVVTQQTIEKFKGHTGSLKTIASRKTDPYVFATGGRDGCICVWDQRVTRRDNSVPTANEIRNAHITGTRQTRKSTSQSITGLCFQEENTLISCASNDGSIKVWDLRRSYKSQKGDPVAKHIFTYHGKSLKQVGYSGLTMDHSKSYIFANCIDDKIYQYSAISYLDDVVASFEGHRNKTFFIKSSISPDDRYLLTGSSDHNAYIYDVINKQGQTFQLQGHTDEVTAVGWNKYDVRKVVTVSDDDSLMIWRLGELTNTDQIIGRTVVSLAKEGHTKIKEKRLHMALNSRQSQNDTEARILPWPVLNGLDIKPKVSPRKLLISPKKICHQSRWIPPPTGLAGFPSEAGTPSLVKRKLDTELFSPVKNNTGGSPVHPLYLSPIRINNSGRSLVNVTPTTSLRGTSLDFSSPTANLPNSVLDAVTPKRIDKENYRRKPDDWLSQYSKEKKRKFDDHVSSDSPEHVNTASTPSRASQCRTRANSKTPTQKKRAVQTLMNYFSPSSTKPSADIECHDEDTSLQLI